MSYTTENNMDNSNYSELLLKALQTCIPDDESMHEYLDKCKINYQHALTILERDLCDHIYMITESNISDTDLMLAIEYFLSVGKFKAYSKRIINDYVTKVTSKDLVKEKMELIYDNTDNEEVQNYISKWI